MVVFEGGVGFEGGAEDGGGGVCGVEEGGGEGEGEGVGAGWSEDCFEEAEDEEEPEGWINPFSPLRCHALLYRWMAVSLVVPILSSLTDASLGSWENPIH